MASAVARVGMLTGVIVRSRPVRWVRLASRGFLADQCLLRASGLTTSTLLALVPLLAIVFAILKGAGFERLLHPLLLDRVPVLSPEAVEQLVTYIGRANAQAVGGIGLAALLISAWSLFDNTERSLNRVFGAPRSRGILSRLGEYVAMLIVATLLLTLSISLQTVLGSQTLLDRFLGDRIAGEATWALVHVLPWLAAWVGFTMVYAWRPTTWVPWRSALAGGILGGSLFQAVQLGYIELQLGFARYHAIYGALAQLPILVVWVYVSWAVTLLGAEAAAWHRVLDKPPDDPDLDGPGQTRSRVAWEVLGEVVCAFGEGRPTPGPEELAARLGHAVQDVRDAVAPLIEARILAEAGEGHGYLPARSPSTVSLDELLARAGRARLPGG